MPLYLCLDQGGHASRALVLDERGAVVTRALREVATQTPSADRVEQDPEALVTSLIDAAHDAVSALGARVTELAAAGLATQRSSIVCWNRETGQALSPVISWQDRRAHEWLTQFTPLAQEIEQRTGLRLSAHYGASKLRWCLDHLEPVRAARQQQRLAIGPLASFLAFRLFESHPFVVDPSNAQRTLLWNLATREWDPWLLERFGIQGDMLPTCVPTRHDFGQLRVSNRTLPITVVTGDQAAALFAFGAPSEGTGYVNLGTGAFAQRVLSEPRRINGLLTGMALLHDDISTYTLEGTVNGAGSALAWAVETLRMPDLESRLPEWLARDAELPLFLNGIGGLGAPYWNANVASCFFGEGEPWQKAVAVAESIVFLLAVNIERMNTAGEAMRALVLTGGLASVDGLCQRLVDLTGLPAWRSDEREATARGLAWLLAGRPKDWPIVSGTRFAPELNAALSERFRRWRTELERALS